MIKSGGMGTVWRARDTGSLAGRRAVALKMIRSDVAADADLVRMFVDEAKITVQLTHANIAQVYELGLVEDTYYFALEYVSGQDAKSLLSRCSARRYLMPVPLTCYVMSKVCEALDYAHDKTDLSGRRLDVVHRDVSPHNVLVGYEGEVKLIDFGIARVAGRDDDEASDVLMGKFSYMSPEQVRSRPLDGRSDIFAAGICLYELLTGEQLFPGSDFEVLEKVLRAEIPPPSRLNPHVPAAVDAAVAKALARDRDQRYQAAGALAEDLQRACFPTGRNELCRFMQSLFAEELNIERRRLAEPEPDLEPVPGERGGTTVLVSADTTKDEQRPTRLESPMRLVPASAVGEESVPSFRVDACPVTNGDYAGFVAQTQAKAPAHWRGPTPPPELEALPVVGLTHAAAQAYAAWAGKRLPTLWEWRAAALVLTDPACAFGVRWEWTSSPSPKGGHFVCGGAHRREPGSTPSPDHVSYELGVGLDVGLRCAR